MKKVLFTLLLTVVGCLTAMADAFTDYVYPDWNEYKVMLSSPTNSEWRIFSDHPGLIKTWSNNPTISMSVEVDKASTLSFEINLGYSAKIFHNGILVRSLGAKYLNNNERRCVFELSEGTHTIKCEFETNGDVEIRNIGVKETSSVTTVKLDVPGSLGAELAYFVKDKLQETRRLKVVGSMNTADWETIGVLKDSLYTLDLSEADVTEVPTRQFYREATNSSAWQFLHNVKLPEGLKKIGQEAFMNSNADVNIPSTVEILGRRSFRESSIKKAIIPECCVTIEGEYAEIFYGCLFLEDVKILAPLTLIPKNMFLLCKNLKSVSLPNTLTHIEDEAFKECHLLNNLKLSESLTYIGVRAFENANKWGEATEMIIPENVVAIESGAFNGSNYNHIQLPMKIYNLDWNALNGKLTSLRLNSPTVVELKDASYPPITSNFENITLQVPDFLVTAYMSDTYWSQFKKVEGFSSDEISDWEINRTLTLTKRDRVKGNPSFVINEEGCFSINGSPAQTINNLRVNINPQDNKYGVFDCNTDAVTINGELSTGFYAKEKNKWYYLVLPYDMKASEVVPIDHTAKHAIRYYDGANRAEVGATGSWKNFEAGAIIPAGTGFIFQASAEKTWWKFPAQNNASKQNVIERNEVSTALAAHPSESQANKGWNLVGNPYTCYYYIRRMNFPAPITIRNGNNYEAYSPIDDEYVLAPYQAFFVQCPDDVNRIDFLIEGCQTTSAVPTGYNAPALASQDAERCLTDIVVSDGVNSDRTRVVLNEQAAIGYETMRDAGKWMGEGNVPQLYTYDEEGNKYAINERPVGNGIVNLGFSTKQNGHFTISLPRNSARKVILVDNAEGLTIDLTSQDYAFMANAGTHDKRFTLYMNGYTTGIDGVSVNDAVKVVEGGLFVGSTNGAVEVFSLDGIKKTAVPASGFVALPAGCYIIKCNGQTAKVVVK